MKVPTDGNGGNPGPDYTPLSLAASPQCPIQSLYQLGKIAVKTIVLMGIYPSIRIGFA